MAIAQVGADPAAAHGADYGRQLYCSVQNVLSGNLGLLLGIAIAAAGAFMFFSGDGKSMGIIMVLIGTSLTAIPQIYQSGLQYMADVTSSLRPNGIGVLREADTCTPSDGFTPYSGYDPSTGSGEPTGTGTHVPAVGGPQTVPQCAHLTDISAIALCEARYNGWTPANTPSQPDDGLRVNPNPAPGVPNPAAPQPIPSPAPPPVINP